MTKKLPKKDISPQLGADVNVTRRQAKLMTSCHVCMHRVIFYISNTLRKLKIRAWGLVSRSVRGVRVWVNVRKRKIIEV